MEHNDTEFFVPKVYNVQGQELCVAKNNGI